MLATYIAGTVAPPTDPVVLAALHAASLRSGVPLALLFSLAWQESRYVVSCRSDKGALGLMQLMPETAAEYNADPFNPAQAAQAGAQFLAGMQRRFAGSWAHALAGYVWGPSRVQRHPQPTSWPTQVQDYVRRVLGGAGYELPFSVEVLTHVHGAR